MNFDNDKDLIRVTRNVDNKNDSGALSPIIIKHTLAWISLGSIIPRVRVKLITSNFVTTIRIS